MRQWYRGCIALVFLSVLAACGGRLAAPPDGPGAAVAPMAVERFLQLAGDRDYVQMGWVFGTKDGAVVQQWPRPEVEKRMYALASVLQHDSYVVGAGSPLPGRIGEAERFTVKLLRGNRALDVPFIVVRGPGQRWFVEQVDLQAVTNTP